MRFVVFAAVSGLLFAAAHASPARFFSTVDDLPLMEGLHEIAAAPFETAQGRIVRLRAEGRVEPAEIAVFYARTLPQLGWRRTDARALAFERAGEALDLRIEPQASGQARATFLITPTSPASPPAR